CTDNACVCVPNCDGKSCGEDGCGGSCGQCRSNEVCTDNACVCVPNCEEKSCGDDGCGGSCGQCSECSDDEAPICAGSRVKSCKNGEYVYTSCGATQSCQKGACVDDPNADPNSKLPMVEMVYDGCSATWASRTGSASLAFLMLMLGVLLRRRRKAN
ncbi:MAG: hypothetical protein IJU23_04470, partial [Proteobacteria bacterium]|nr:hypothetical protein [Pseudomonadota bacterium]